MADRVIMLPALDSNGNPVPGAQAFFYEAGTLNPVVVYADQAGTVPLGTIATANAAGVFPPVFTTSSLRLDVRDSEDASLPGYPSDFWYVVPSAGLGAATITFEPIEGNNATNVAGAIGNITALWNAVTAFGRTLIGLDDAAAVRAELGLSDGATASLASQAEAEVGTNNTKLMTPLRTKQAIDAQVSVGEAIAAIGFGEIGSGAFMQSNTESTSTFTVGQLVAGSDLRYSGLRVSNTSSDQAFSSGPGITVPAGTWRSHGAALANGSAGYYTATYFVRVS